MYYVARADLGACYNCGKPGHIQRDCPEDVQFTCYLCGKRGHIARQCDAKENEDDGAEIPPVVRHPTPPWNIVERYCL